MGPIILFLSLQVCFSCQLPAMFQWNAHSKSSTYAMEKPLASYNFYAQVITTLDLGQHGIITKFCGGVFVHTAFVLTTAECVEVKEPSSTWVIVGELTAVFEQREQIRVKEIKSHMLVKISEETSQYF